MPTTIPTYELHGRTPTMLGVWCPATGPAALTCIYGADHSVGYHQSPGGEKWTGSQSVQIPVTVTVGHLAPATVGTITAGDGATRQALAALLRDVADVLDIPKLAPGGVVPACPAVLDTTPEVTP